jgi:O-antigen biosynthesis protein
MHGRGATLRVRTVASLKERIRPYYLRWIYFRVAPGARPPNFVSCWRYPYRRLGEAGLAEFRPAPDEGPDILWYPMTDWHARLQRTQHLARAMAQLGHRGLYLNPHLGREFESTRLADPRHRVSLLEANLMELHVRLPREPVFHHRLLGSGESRTVAEAVTEALGPASPAGAVQILSLPVWLDAALEMRKRHGWRIVYDCHDLLSGFSNMAPEIVAAEERVFAEADRIVFSSETLLRRHERWKGKVVLVRNGVDAARFRADAPKPESAPIVGYVGAIEEWFDVAAMTEAAAANPEWQFVVAGRMENPAAAQLARLPNVRMPGEVAYDDVPALVRQFRVGLIPFLVNDLTRAADPIKMYEYFACGIPVVSSRLPEVEPHGGLVYLASSPAEFVAAIRAALAEDDARLRERRISVARGASWTERARELLRAAAGPSTPPSAQS